MNLTVLILGGIATLFGLLVMVAAAIAVIKSSYTKTQIEALRGDRDDLQARVTMLESENKVFEKEAREAKAALNVLNKFITAKQDIEALNAIVIAGQKEARSQSEYILRTIIEIRDILKKGPS